MDEELEELREQIDQIDNDVYELKEYVLPDEDEKPSLGFTKFAVIMQIVLFGFVFLIGMLIGMVV